MTERKRARPAVLVIAGTDSSGGAGLTRDVRVLTDFGLDVLCAVTAVTAQSDSGLTHLHHVPPQVVRAQIAAAFATRAVAAIKIGMLGTLATVQAVAESLADGGTIPIVLDPVMVASSGAVLLETQARTAMCQTLFPLATLITPNIPEAEALLGDLLALSESALVAQAQRLLGFGSAAVLLKGGHARGDEAVDLLVANHNVVHRIASPRVPTAVRGTGCALASAIAAGLAAGAPLVEACRQAKRYVQDLLCHRKGIE